MLVALAAASWICGSRIRGLMVLCLVLPFNILVGTAPSSAGDAGWLLAADQYLAGSCAVIDPVVAIGVVVCQLVGAVTGAMGAPPACRPALDRRRRVRCSPSPA